MLVAPLLLTILLRVLWLRAFPVDPIAPVDAEGFHLLASNVLNGHGFAFGWEAPFCPTALRTPGYPAALAGWYALIGAQAQRAVYLHLLLEVITTAMVMHLARQIESPVKLKTRQLLTPLVAGVLYAFNPLTPRYTGVLYAEILFVPVFLVALSITMHLLNHPRVRVAAPAGLLWATAILVKPNVQYLVALTSVFIFVYFMIKSTKNNRQIILKIALIYIVSIGIVLSAWIARNSVLLGSWRISTAFEENLARVTVPAILAELDGQAVEPWTDTWEHYYDRFLVDVLGDQAWIFRAEPEEVCLERADLEPRLTRAARALLRDNRWLYMRVHLLGVLRGLRDPGHRYWYTLLTGENWAETGVVVDMGERAWWSLRQGAVGDAFAAFWSQRVRDIPATAGLVWWVLVLLRILVSGLALYGLWCQRHHPWVVFLLALNVVYFFLLPGPIAYERFFIPVLPVIMALTAFAVGTIVQPAYNRAYPDS